MRENSCCFSGHRLIDLRLLGSLEVTLNAQICALIKQGVRQFYAGGALGFDMMAAHAVLKLREQFPVTLHLLLPCHNQEYYWMENNRICYQAMLEKADEVQFLAGHYHRGCMHRRNRALVDHSAHCICYLERDSGGTAYTVNYAKKQGLAVYNLAEGLA